MVLVLLLLGVPLLELFMIVRLSGSIGVWETISLMVLISLAGAWMVRRSGFGVLRQMRARLEQGQLPGKELLDGALIVVAGALLLTPGFLTDGVGLLLLAPPSRIAVRTLLLRRFRARFQVGGWPSDQVFHTRKEPRGGDGWSAGRHDSSQGPETLP